MITDSFDIIRTKEGVWVLKEDSHLSRWIEEHGRLDIADGEIAQFAKYIPKGGVVIDAGASLGDHTATYAKLVGPSGKVFAFEPNPGLFACLWRNMEEFRWVTPLNYALGSLNTKVDFHREHNAGASYVSPGSGIDPDIMVDVTTLDSLDLPISRCDFIHLDAEGYEPFILDGAREFLRKFTPVMLIEVCHSHLQRQAMNESSLMLLLDSLHYRVEEIDGTPASEQRDILCLPN